MNFNTGQLPPHVQQQLHLQALQQQRLANLTPQQQIQYAQAQAQMAANGGNPTTIGGAGGVNGPNRLTIQQHQQLTAQRLAALKQKQAQHQAVAAAQVQQAQAQQLHQHQQLAAVTAAQREQLNKFAPGGPMRNVPQMPPPKQWDSMKYWSEKMEKEGEQPETDVLMFEQLINRDMINRELLLRERTDRGNKPLLTRLMRDLKYYNDLKLARMKTIQFSSSNQYTRSIWGEGYQGYGNGFTDGPTRVLLPNSRKKPSRMKSLYIPKKANDAQAEVKSEFVPIRLDIDAEKDRFRLRDTFLWDLNDKLTTPEQAVSTLMEDYRFTNPLFADTVLASVKEQLNDYHRHMYTTEHGYDQRIVVKLDITIGNMQLLDQFEWDISNPENNPEEFATVMTEELSLAPEFATAIAHSIREQAQMYTKSLYLIGYDFKGGFIDDDEIRAHLSNIITKDEYLRPRGQLSLFTPQMLEISNNELERLDKDRERDSRRKRRQGRVGRRGGPTLPDLSDFPRTFRTPVPSTVLPGGLDLGPDVSSYTEYVETTRRPVQVDQTKVEQDPVQALQADAYASSGASKHATPLQESTTLKKRKVTVNHIPGVRCIVSIKL